MADEHRFEYESLQNNKSIQYFLKALVEGFEKGLISLSIEDKEIHLYPNALLKFKVKARKKPGAANQLQIKISWKESRENKDDPQQTIRIIS
ncbi:MAG: amphi-Trp domain-containing protein [Desulfobacterales bacterium]